MSAQVARSGVVRFLPEQGCNDYSAPHSLYPVVRSLQGSPTVYEGRVVVWLAICLVNKLEEVFQCIKKVAWLGRLQVWYVHAKG